VNAAKPFKWSDLTQHERFLDATPEQRRAIQDDYFNRFIAPELPEHSLTDARVAFYERTANDIEPPEPGLIGRAMETVGGWFDEKPISPLEEVKRDRDRSGIHPGRQNEYERELFKANETQAKIDLGSAARSVGGFAKGMFTASDEERETDRGIHPSRQMEREASKPELGELDVETGHVDEFREKSKREQMSTLERRWGDLRSLTAAVPQSFGAASEGIGLLSESFDANIKDRVVQQEASVLKELNGRMEAELEQAPEDQRDQILDRYAPDITRQEVALENAIIDLAEREPGMVSSAFRSAGVGLQELGQTLDVDPEKRGFSNDVAGGLGSMVTYLGPGVLANALTRGSALAAGSVSVSMAGPSGVSEAYSRAISAGLSEEEAIKGSARGLLPGVVQVAPLASLVRQLPPELQGRAIGQVYGILRTGGAEATVESAGAVMQNLIEQSYNPERGTWDDVAYQGTIGAISGGGMQAGMQFLTRGRGMNASRGQQSDLDTSGLSAPTDTIDQAPDAPPEAASTAAEATFTPDQDAEFKQVWRTHEQENNLDPLPDITEPTGIQADVVASRSEPLPQAEGDQLSQLIADNPESPALQRARDNLIMGEGYTTLKNRAQGNADATDALERMQKAAFEADAAETPEQAAQLRSQASVAYREARHAIDRGQQAETHQQRTQAAIDQAREQTAAQGGDALDQVLAAEQAEAVAASDNMTERDALEQQQQAEVEAAAQPLVSPRMNPGRFAVERVDTGRIEVDPAAYQFRTEVNRDGVDQRLDGVQQWDDLRAGNILLHERADGRLFAADGHHRVDLARRLQQPDVNAIVLRENDGYGVQDARREAAEANIAAGNATATDAAKVFRDSEAAPTDVIAQRNLPRNQVVRDGVDISRLGDEAFGAVLNSVVTEKDGAAIGRYFDDPAQQLAAVDVFRRVQPQNDNQRALLANEIRQAGFDQSQGEQSGLFGDDPAESLIGERVKVMDRLRQTLVGNRRLFATLNRNADTASQAGNVINVEQNTAESDRNAQAVSLLERATTTPEINQQINDAARRVRDGQTVADAVRELQGVLLNATGSEASDTGRTPALSSGQADQTGQDAGTGEPVSAVNEPRTAGASQQRMGGDGQADASRPAERPSADQQVTLRKNGQPFATEKSVRVAKAFRDTPGATPVQVEGGWGFVVQETAQQPAAAPTIEQQPAQPAANKQRKPEKLTPRQQLASDTFGGAMVGDTIKLATDVGYSKAGDSYTVDSINKDGTLQATSVERGSSVLISQGEWTRASRQTRSAVAQVVSTAADSQPQQSASEQQAETPDLTLETQTEQSLAEQAEQTQAAEQAEAEQRRQEAERAQADRDADDFVLSGSDTDADQAMARGQDSLFRLSPDGAISQHRDAIAEAVSQHPELAGVQTVALPGELPQQVQNAMLRQGVNPSQVRGVYVGGDLYVVAANIDSVADGVKYAVHEAVGHKGVREVLGERLDTEMQRLYSTFPQTHEVWQTVKANYSHIDTNTREGRREFAEELAAHLAETNPEVNGWQRFVARVRDMLRQAFGEVAWTESDVRALIQRSREHLQHQQVEQAAPVIMRYSKRGGEDALFSLDANRPSADQLRTTLEGEQGLGKPSIVDNADQLDLDTSLMLTVRGIDPQSVVAFTHNDRLHVIAANAESAEAAKEAAVLERVRQKGLKHVIGDRISTVTNEAYKALASEPRVGQEARETLRSVRSAYSYLDPSLPADRSAMMLEVAERLNARGSAPGFITEMLSKVRSLVNETHGITNAGDLSLANRAYITKTQREFGNKAPPEYSFGLDLQAGPGVGTLTEMAGSSIDADGRPIDDMKISSAATLNPASSAARAFVFSQTDRLRQSGNEVLVELGNRVDRAYDKEDARTGQIMKTLRPALLEMEKGGRKQRIQNQRDFEQYWRDHENGRTEQAQAVYDRNPAVAKMIDATAEMFFDTGTENQRVKTPSRTGIWVRDENGYRVIGRNRKGKHWPRVMRPEVSEVIRDPGADMELWDQLVSAIVDSGKAANKQEAGTWLREHQAKEYSAEASNDFVAAMERARGEQLPEIFYDYSLEVVTDYARNWAKRISQIEAFGQVLKPNDKTSFDEAIAMTSDPKTKEYIGRLQRVVFNTQDIGPGGRFMRNTNVLATGLHLTNWATAAQNVVTGSGMNASMFGGRRMMRAYFELMRDYKSIRQEGLELGILGKDTLNLIRDSERNGIGSTGDTNRSGHFAKLMERVAGKRLSASEALREFASFGMKWGGYTGTEQLIRANAMVSAKLQLKDALNAWNKAPDSAKAGKYRRFMRQNRIDVDALINENGKGEETARYLRLMVNIPQGSYRADMVPQIVDTEVGRWVGKYQKFGTQTSRMFWQQKMEPMLKAFTDPEASAQERASAFLDTLNFVGWGLVSGLVNRSVRAALFGMAFVGADTEEIWDRFKDGEFLLAASLLVDNLWHNAMSAGYVFGVFSTPLQAAKDYRDRARMRNPLDPPALAVFEESANLLVKFAQQDYNLTGGDMLDAVMRVYGLPRVAERSAATLTNAVSPVIDLSIDRLDYDIVRRDVSYIRGATRRWADQVGIEASMGGSFSPGSTPNTPGNNRIHRAVSLGNNRQARQAVSNELRGLHGEEYQRRLMSIRSTLNARHPLRVGSKKMNEDERHAFMRWARNNLPSSRYETIQTRVREYERAMNAALDDR
jgi:hypothetical protein